MNTDTFIAPDEYLTEKLLLRRYRPGDGPDLHVATIESYEHLAPWMPWASETQTEEQSERIARELCGRYLLATDFTIAIRSTDDRTLLGGCGFHLREGPLESGNAEIGMWIRGNEAGRGLGTEALRAMIRWGFTAWPWTRLSWRCDGRNVASCRIAEKTGMQEEGRLRDHLRAPDGEKRDTICYAILRHEWSSGEDPEGERE